MKSATGRGGKRGGAAASPALARGRDADAHHAWRDAFDALSSADRETPLGDQDLERLAWSAALAGQTTVHHATLERLHDLRLAERATLPAARAAFWLGLRLLTMGEVGRGTAWLGRAERLVESQGDCVERGYLMVPRGYHALFRNQATEEACAFAREAAAIGDRFGEPDLAGLARMLHGQALTAAGDHEAIDVEAAIRRDFDVFGHGLFP